MFERCLYFNVNSLARKVNAIWDAAYAEFDLSPSHAYLLRLVLDKPGMTQNNIAKELNLDKSTVTRFVHVLEDRQLLVRSRSGREVHVSATSKAKKLKARLNKTGDELYQAMQVSVGKAELINMVKNLRESGGSL